MQQAYAFDVSSNDFVDKVIQGSKDVPVLVDFWAEWCAPCRVLKPVLEKLAQEYHGAFHLAKLNVDENQQLAAEFGVRGIPNVKAFVDGELVDEFSGAQPERAVRAFIERLLPDEAEQLRREAMQRHAGGESTEALQMLNAVLAANANNDKARLDAAEVAAALGMQDEAQSHLNALGPLLQDDPRALKLKARLQFAPGNAAADEAELAARIRANAADLEARLQLANLLVTQRRYESAMEQLLEIIRRDRKFGDDIGRKTLLSVFSLIDDQTELVGKYRRLLASALH